MKMKTQKKPQICYVNPTMLIKRPVSEISSRMADADFKTSILIPKKLFRKEDASLHHSKLMSKSNVHAYGTVNLPFMSSEQPLPLSFFFCKYAWKALKENDIIHMWVPYYLTNLKILFLKRLFFRKKKLILTMDTVPGYSFSMGKTMDFLFKSYTRIFRGVLFGAPDIITLYGESMVPYALKAGVSQKKIRVISTGIQLRKNDGRESGKNRIETRKKLGISIKPDTTVILYAGLLVPRKGIHKIIMMADKLRNEDIVFLLAGDGPRRKEYEQQAKKLGLENKIIFLGWRTDMAKLYQASDIFLLPAEGEGLPGVVMEAMSYGVPCIASNIPCIPDLIDDGKSGFLCEKDDVDMFTKRVKELLHDRQKRERFGREARRRIALFDWSKVIKKYEALYNEQQK
jgi:glycosyltransferase involved in cell wall biosynthesis